MIGVMLVGEIEQNTNIKFRNVDDFETSFIAIDVEYDSENVIFKWWLYKVNTPQFNMVSRYRNREGTDFKQVIDEYIGNNCSFPTSSIYFMIFFKHLTTKVYTEDFFLLFEQNKDDQMWWKMLGNNHFVKKHKINTGCYDGFRVCSINTTEKKIALYMNKNHFCLIWKSQGISFNEAIKELKTNLKVVDNVILGKHV